MKFIKYKPIILKYASKRLRNDKQIAIEAVTKGKKNAFEFISNELKQDEEIKKILE